MNKIGVFQNDSFMTLREFVDRNVSLASFSTIEHAMVCTHIARSAYSDESEKMRLYANLLFQYSDYSRLIIALRLLNSDEALDNIKLFLPVNFVELFVDDLSKYHVISLSSSKLMLNRKKRRRELLKYSGHLLFRFFSFFNLSLIHI